MTFAATPDPTREQVEEVLQRVVRDLARLPCELARSARRRAAQPVDVVRSLVALAWAGVAGRSPSAPPSASPEAPRRTAPSAETRPTPQEAEPATTITADGLPIENYESLAASQVVARLERLDAGERAQIAEFEAAHRGRRTVLGKIDQLNAASG